jgi:hypothetical protein
MFHAIIIYHVATLTKITKIDIKHAPQMHPNMHNAFTKHLGENNLEDMEYITLIVYKWTKQFQRTWRT